MIDYKPKTRKDPTCCPKCKGCDLYSASYSDTVEFRGLDLDVEGLHYTTCAFCKNRFENQEQKSHNDELIRSAYARKRDELRIQDGLLSSEQIQSIRKKYSLTQREAAIIFGGGSNAFNKYETGEVLQSVAMDRLLRLIDIAGMPAVRCLEVITKKTRPNFSLPHLDQRPALVQAPLVVSVGHDSSYQLRIIGQRTQEAIVKAISETTFVEENKITDINPMPLLINGTEKSGIKYFREITA